MTSLDAKCPSCGKSPTPQRVCANCNRVTEDGERLCNFCGVKCPYCTAKMDSFDRLCDRCGRYVTVVAGAPGTGSDWELVNKRHPWAAFVIFAAVACCAYLLFIYDTSVPAPQVVLDGQTYGTGRVHNLGLMQNRTMGAAFSGGIAVLAGVYLMTRRR